MLEEIIEYRLLLINETQMQKIIKKIIFIIISIIFPIMEIVLLIYQGIFLFNQNKGSIIPLNEFFIAVYGFLSFGSFFCTLSMISVCYLEIKCLATMLLSKLSLIILIIIFSLPSDDNYYVLVFNVIGYGIFYTLILVYESFRKGIIWDILLIFIYWE